ncbi:AraC family transcriptional regulator [Sutcliffiella halmapala]|uniref:AraC family transcriptional regulator n=1 Tax=Sutcliffiella halmapala TaxID=79882 RepID=UPI000995A719|nr:AraC family transcriptional regulator [Sutcliffiella halmapala]
MKYADSLQKVIDLIDENIHDEWSVGDLAKCIGYSPYHFSRIFKEVVGETPMEFVAKRKLQFALKDMSTELKMDEIAFRYGYGSYVGFSKAFKKIFGVSPALYRMHCPNANPPRIQLQELQSLKTGGIIVQPKIVHKESFTIVGRSYEGQMLNISSTKDAPAYWQHQGLTDGEIETTLYKTFTPTFHGEFCLNIPSENNWEKFTYFFGVLNEQLERPIPETFQCITIPATTYAVFSTPLVKVEHFADSVKGTWQYILQHWFPHSSYVIDEKSYDFEFYDERCHHWDHELVMMEIFIPIKRESEGI